MAGGSSATLSLPCGVRPGPVAVLIDCLGTMRGAPNERFQTTSWSLVLAAAAHPTTASRTALGALCGIYWCPIYAFIRRQGYDRDQAQDLTQGFFALLLERHYLGDADRQRGKFRAFLLTAVKHFLANEWDREHALKRGGNQVLISVDPGDLDSWYASEAVEQRTPESLFERRWALALLEHVMGKLRAEFSGTEKGNHFDKLLVFLNGDPEAIGYEALAAQLGSSTGALRVAIHRMRRRYRALLRAEIADTVSTAEQVDEEIRFLRSILST